MYFKQDSGDATLVGRSLEGDESAFETLVTRYQRVLFNVAMRMLGDYAEAEDATQAALIKAYRSLGTFDPKQRFFSWLYRILLNECLNAQRDRRPHEPIALETAGGEGPLEALEAAERRRIVQHALLALPHEYREVIVLRHYAELRYEDIAASLGIATKTVKSRLYTARQRLMELLIVEKTRT